MGRVIEVYRARGGTIEPIFPFLFFSLLFFARNVLLIASRGVAWRGVGEAVLRWAVLLRWGCGLYRILCVGVGGMTDRPLVAGSGAGGAGSIEPSGIDRRLTWPCGCLLAELGARAQALLGILVGVPPWHCMSCSPWTGPAWLLLLATADAARRAQKHTQPAPPVPSVWRHRVTVILESVHSTTTTAQRQPDTQSLGF